jgi:hypothetical protein
LIGLRQVFRKNVEEHAARLKAVRWPIQREGLRRLAIMPKFKFKRGILKVMSPALEKLGYVFIGYYPVGQGPYGMGLGASDHLYCEKVLQEMGMKCWIGFQLSQHSLPPFSKREFTVDLSRMRDPDVTTDCVCEAVGTRLPQLLQFYFNVPVYLGSRGRWGEPPSEEEDQKSPVYLSSTQWWEFETQQEFEEQLANVLDNLLKYGIPWLEDPKSKMPPWGYFGPPPPGEE